MNTRDISTLQDCLKALELIRDTRRASTSHFQRHLGFGYNHAAFILDRLEDLGAVSPQSGSEPRIPKLDTVESAICGIKTELERIGNDSHDDPGEPDSGQLYAKTLLAIKNLKTVDTNTLVELLRVDRCTARDLFSRLEERAIVIPDNPFSDDPATQVNNQKLEAELARIQKSPGDDKNGQQDSAESEDAISGVCPHEK